MNAHEYHTPVLPDQVLNFLQPRKGGVYVDCTLGGGGHAELILDRIGAEGMLVGFDRDSEAVRAAGERLSRFGGSVHLIDAPFDSLQARIGELNIAMADGILFDLGLSSRQVDDPGRGFSFSGDGPVDMRMNQAAGKSGAEVLNQYPEEKLKSVIREYGEERFAGRIAHRIVQARSRKPIATTAELAEIVRRAVGGRLIIKSLARVFQAIRIEVNDELGMLKRALDQAVQVLAPGGRIVVIAYNSLEDRIVKHWMRQLKIEGLLTPLTKKPVVPTAAELVRNSRGRSAKLRAAERAAA